MPTLALKYSRDYQYPLRSHPCSTKVLPLSEGLLWFEYPCLCSQQVRSIRESTPLRSSPPPVTVDKYPNSLFPSLGMSCTNYPSPPWLSSLVAHSAKCHDKTIFTDFPHYHSVSLDLLPNLLLIVESLLQSMLLGKI